MTAAACLIGWLHEQQAQQSRKDTQQHSTDRESTRVPQQSASKQVQHYLVSWGTSEQSGGCQHANMAVVPTVNQSSHPLVAELDRAAPGPSQQPPPPQHREGCRRTAPRAPIAERTWSVRVGCGVQGRDSTSNPSLPFVCGVPADSAIDYVSLGRGGATECTAGGYKYLVGTRWPPPWHGAQRGHTHQHLNATREKWAAYFSICSLFLPFLRPDLGTYALGTIILTSSVVERTYM